MKITLILASSALLITNIANAVYPAYNQGSVYSNHEGYTYQDGGSGYYDQGSSAGYYNQGNDGSFYQSDVSRGESGQGRERQESGNYNRGDSRYSQDQRNQYSQDREMQGRSDYNQNRGEDRNFDQNRNFDNRGLQRGQSSTRFGQPTSFESSTNQSTFSRSGQATNLSDKDLNSKINADLKNSSSAPKFKDVTVIVTNGAIIISGFVDNEQDRQELKNRILQFKGLKNIDDRLVLRNKAYERKISDSGFRSNQESSYGDSSSSVMNKANTDRKLEQDIRDALKPGYFTKGYENVTAIVNNGYVILNGTVDSEEDKLKVFDKVKKLDGIKSIDNQLRIQTRHTSY